DGRLRNRDRNREVEVTPKVGDRLVLDAFEPRSVGGLVRAKLLREQEIASGFLVFELQPMPIDDGVAAQDEPRRLEVHQRELVEAFEPANPVVRHSGEGTSMSRENGALGRPRGLVTERVALRRPRGWVTTASALVGPSSKRSLRRGAFG